MKCSEFGFCADCWLYIPAAKVWHAPANELNNV